jgi:hypothetical protein
MLTTQEQGMVETSNRIDSGTPPLSSQAVDGRAPRSAATGARAGGNSASPSGQRGLRLLSPDTPVDQLDRSAPRGTYLDILV